MVKGALNRLLKEEFPDRDTLNFVTLDMNENTLNNLADECSFIPLGAENKAVVADDFQGLTPTARVGRGRGKKKKDEKSDGVFYEYLSHPDENVFLYILVYNSEINKDCDLYAALSTAGAKFASVSEFTPEQWASFIPSFFDKRGVSIETSAIAELSKRINNDYARFLSEAQKLISYVGDEKMVSLSDVKLLVAEPLEDDAYHLANALSRGDVRKALEIYDDLKLSSVDEVSLLRLLGRQFRFLNEIRYLRDHKMRPDEIASTMFASTARINVSLANLQRMGDETLNKALEGLYQTEFKIMTGQMDEELAFTLYLASFSL
jgi:DNA polymerase-3 subunit delta